MLSVPDFDSLSPKFTAALESLESFKNIQTTRTSVVTAPDHVLELRNTKRQNHRHDDVVDRRHLNSRETAATRAC